MHRMAREQTVLCILGTAQIAHLNHSHSKLLTWVNSLGVKRSWSNHSGVCDSIQISLKGQITQK